MSIYDSLLTPDKPTTAPAQAPSYGIYSSLAPKPVSPVQTAQTQATQATQQANFDASPIGMGANALKSFTDTLNPLTIGTNTITGAFQAGAQAYSQFPQTIATDIQRGADISNKGLTPASPISQQATQLAKGTTFALAKGLGDIVGTVFSPLSGAIGGALKSVGAQTLIDSGGQVIADRSGITDWPAFQQYAEQHPNAAGDWGSLMNLVLAGDLKGTDLNTLKSDAKALAEKIIPPKAPPPTAETPVVPLKLNVKSEGTVNPVPLKTPEPASNPLAQEADQVLLDKLTPRQKEAFSQGTPQEQQRALEHLRLKDNIEANQNPLAKEAQKYSSAEEFVKAQGEPLYHGTGEKTNFETFDATKTGVALNRGPAIYLTENKVAADYFSRLKSQSDYYQTPEFKNSSSGYGAIGDFKGNVKDVYVDPSAKIKQLDTLPQSTAKETIAKLKSEGYDGVTFVDDVLNTIEGQIGLEKAFVNGVHPKTTMIFNPNVLKTKSQLTDFYNKVKGTPGQPAIPKPPEAVTPQKTGTVTKVASDINDTLVKQGYEALSPEVQSKYTPESYKEELSRAKTLPYEELTARATGRKAVGNYEGQILFNEAERQAIANNDIQTLQDLAVSPLGKKLSLAGQTMGAHGFNDNPNSPVENIRAVKNAREAEVAKRGATIKKDVVAKIKDSIKKSNTKENWGDFVKSLEC